MTASNKDGHGPSGSEQLPGGESSSSASRGDRDSAQLSDGSSPSSFKKRRLSGEGRVKTQSDSVSFPTLGQRHPSDEEGLPINPSAKACAINKGRVSKEGEPYPDVQEGHGDNGGDQSDDGRLLKGVAQVEQQKLYQYFLPDGLLDDFVCAALSLDEKENSRDSSRPLVTDAVDRASLRAFASVFYLLVEGRGISAEDLQRASAADKQAATRQLHIYDRDEREEEENQLNTFSRSSTHPPGERGVPGMSRTKSTDGPDRGEKKKIERTKKVLAVELASSPVVFLRGKHSREVLVQQLLRRLRGSGQPRGTDEKNCERQTGSQTASAAAARAASLFEAWMKALKIFLSFLTGSSMIGRHAKSAALVAVFDLLLILLSPDEHGVKPNKAQDNPGDADGKLTVANDSSPKGGSRTLVDLSRPVLDFNNFVDLLVEFVRVLPLSEVGAVIQFLEENKSNIISAFHRKGREYLSSPTSSAKQADAAQAKRVLQAAGAKVIGMVKSIEEPLVHANEKQHVFALRRLLMDTLSLTHAGLSNRTMQKAETSTVVLDSLETWKSLNQLETADAADPGVSATPGSNLSPNKVSATSHSTSSGSTPKVDKTATGAAPDSGYDETKGDAASASTAPCSYSIYAAYGKALPFLQSPDLVLEQKSEVLAGTLQALETLLAYFEEHPTTGSCDITRLATGDDSTLTETSFASLGDKAAENLLLLSCCGGIPDYLSAGAFRERVDTTFFRREIVTRAAVAFQFLGRAVAAGCADKKDQAGDTSSTGGSTSGGVGSAGQGSAPASTKKDGQAGVRGETGLAAQRLYSRIRDNFKALDEKEKNSLTALEARVWSLAGKVFAPATFPPLSSTSPTDGVRQNTSPVAIPSMAVAASENNARRWGAGFTSVNDDDVLFSSSRRSRYETVKEPNSLEKLLQTEHLWVYWKERNCFDSVLKPLGNDQLTYSERDVCDEDLLPFVVQCAVSTAQRGFTGRDTERSDPPLAASGSLGSSSASPGIGTGASGESAQKGGQAGRQKAQGPGDEKKSEHVAGTKDSEKSAAASTSSSLSAGQSSSSTSNLGSETGEKTRDAKEKVLEEARRLAQQADAPGGSCCFEDSPGTKMTRETAAMRRFIRWLRVWEKKAEAEQDDSLLRSASGLSSPPGSPRTPKLAADETQTGEVSRKPLAFPDPVTLLRQADEWFCSTEKQNLDNYRNVRFGSSVRSIVSVLTSLHAPWFTQGRSAARDHAWRERSCLLFIEKLRQKLRDYVQKLDDDDNPDNGVEEDEKSKNNPLFCFRLQRLFGIFYGDAYCAMAYKDTRCEDLRQAISDYDKGVLKPGMTQVAAKASNSTPRSTQSGSNS
ncbi:hypothetical protein CSUI_007829 [Cystoisospora suis]|uniref:Uncharacterized protein n=1 Tax=Cystoisospora suis TaxID=483139 RepID=A0A2C6KC58_9APIC|nr:hypothetical protein CSUI_007829 [Cystoisospora suis]